MPQVMAARYAQLTTGASSCLLVLALTATSLCTAAPSQDSDELTANFQHPPAVAKPYVWWHWIDGNVTQDGIQRDLQWMHRVGIGGVQVVDVVMGTPALVSPLAEYGSTAWKEDLRYAVQTASNLDIDFVISSVPGFSESGGPWVQPDEGMKKLVWNVTHVEGGHLFHGTLPQPPSVPGPFQDVPINRISLTAGAAPAAPLPNWYRDIAVLAYRIPAVEKSMADMGVNAKSSAGALVNPEVLWDGDLHSAVAVPVENNGSDAWLQYSFKQPQTIRAVTVSILTGVALPFISDLTKPIAQLQASVDGSHYFKVCDVAAAFDVQQTIAFQPVTAQTFRLLLPPPAPPANPIMIKLPVPSAHQVAEFVLHTVSRTDRIEEKAGYFTSATPFGSAAQNESAVGAVQPDDIVDLTSRMTADGSFVWAPPRGHWEILRLGYSLEGTTNHPGGPSSTGLEVDKLSSKHVKANFVRYLDSIDAALGSVAGQSGVQAMLNDSWEAGCENWTEELPQQFAARHGYALLRWLPALTGRIIGDPSRTERFLWDFRQTLSELLAENHYQVIAQELHRRGMIHYAESHEHGRAFVGDGMAVKRYADVPMGAMWAGGLGPQPGLYDSDLRESASVAHLYGRPIVAAESLTMLGNWFASTPEQLKPLVDRELADGVNRFMLHESAHQPLNDVGPGLTLGPFGQWFTRKETWADQAGAWMSYLARSSYLLQQGTPVADVLYFYGEDSNITALYDRVAPGIPEGYDYDYINREALDLLAVRDGKLVTGHGTAYRILVLDPRTRNMSLPVLRRLQALAVAGGTILGAKPVASPSLGDNTQEFDRLAAELWGSGDGNGTHAVGKGRVISQSIADGVVAANVTPDITYTPASATPAFRYTHRRLDAGDIYFISNRQATAIESQVSFRTTGRVPEIWHADSGHIEAVSYSQQDGRTVVPLALGPSEAVFVVFRRATDTPRQEVSPTVRTTLATFDGEWQQQFADHSRRSSLTSWTTDADAEIRYFSGTAVYTRTLTASASWFDRQSHLELDLGTVRNVAAASVNGRDLGIAWHAPFRFDVTDAIHPGPNQIEIRVTNTWVNRLIGDRQPNATLHAFTTFNPYQPDSPLLESGLLGPVRLLRLYN